MNVYKKEAYRLNILTEIYKLSNGNTTKFIEFKEILNIFPEEEHEAVNAELFYFREKNFIGGSKPVVFRGFKYFPTIKITSIGIDLVEMALKGQTFGDFSQKGVQIFIDSYHNTVNSIENSSGSSIVSESQNVKVTINNQTENEILDFLKSLQRSEESNEAINTLAEKGISILEKKEGDWKNKIKSILFSIYSIGGSVVANLLTPEIQNIIDQFT